MSQRYPSRVIGAALLLSGVIGAVSAASTTSLQPVTREMLCVTEGALAELGDQRFFGFSPSDACVCSSPDATSSRSSFRVTSPDIS